MGEGLTGDLGGGAFGSRGVMTTWNGESEDGNDWGEDEERG